LAAEAMLPHINIRINKIYLPFTSRGIFHIFFNLIYLKWKTRNTSGLFHISGDVHYSVLALPANRTILTIHDLVFLHTYRGITRRILKWLYLELPIRKAQWITTISEKSKQEILDHSDCEPDKIKVIPDPIDPTFLNLQPPSTPLNLPQPCILFLGTKPNKNLELSIPALFQLPIHLRIIGELTSQQKKLLKKFRIDYSNVHNITQAQLVHEYMESDIILFPSTYEGFGLPVIEAFATRKPVITSNISPMKEVAANAALLIDPSSIASIREAIQQIIMNPQLQKQYTEAGRSRLLDFLPAQITDHYRKLWGEMNKDGL
jgi:glycosyltransferase involved in cell wall biosynthesis